MGRKRKDSIPGSINELNIVIDLREAARKAAQEAAKKNHKCTGCLWGKYIDHEKVLCSFSRCVKDEL